MASLSFPQFGKTYLGNTGAAIGLYKRERGERLPLGAILVHQVLQLMLNRANLCVPMSAQLLDIQAESCKTMRDC